MEAIIGQSMRKSAVVIMAPVAPGHWSWASRRLVRVQER